MNRLIVVFISALYLASQAVPVMADQRRDLPTPMFRNQVPTRPVYRTAPGMRSDLPFVQHQVVHQDVHQDVRQGGSWSQRFTHERHNNNGYHDGDSRQGYDSNNTSGGTGNLTVPLYTLAGAILVNAFTKPRPVQNTTVTDSYNTSNTTTSNTNTNTNTSAQVNVPATLIPVNEARPEAVLAPAPEPTAYSYHDVNDGHYHDDGAGPVERHVGNAPADEYFGHSHMSILGIRNTVNDIYTQVDTADENRANDLCWKLQAVENSYRDWQAKYPQDSWILQYGYAMVNVYAKLDAELPNENPHVAAIHGIDLGNFLDATYPGNQYVK